MFTCRVQYCAAPHSDPRVRHGGHPGDRPYRRAVLPPGRGPPSHQQSGPPPGGPGPSQRDKRVRWFVALYDYNPTTMSPNPDACEEELPFSEGDTIKVLKQNSYQYIENNSTYPYALTQ